MASVKYEPEAESTSGPKIYHLPPPSHTPIITTGLGSAAGAHPHPRRFPRRQLHHRPRRDSPTNHIPTADDPIIRRRHIYRHQLYSRRVGTNRLSKYCELTPQLFNQDAHLVSRARKWIRRELQVFSFLDPTSNDDIERSAAADRRAANNAEFLLEYIIAILRTVDIKGSSGQAEELLREFIGRDHARLFLHELQSWLRSPYISLADWDRAVQYDDVDADGPRLAASVGIRAGMGPRSSRHADARSISWSSSTTPVAARDRGRGRDCAPSWPSGRISKATSTPGTSRCDNVAADRERRIQRARDRYQPD